MLAVVGNTMWDTTSFTAMVFSSDLQGHAGAGVGVLGDGTAFMVPKI
jgi:hypothetical protein